MKKMSNLEIEKELIAITEKLLVESNESHKRNVKINDSLQSLGIDSLSRAELFRRVEELFGLTISDRLFAEAETLNDVMVYLQKAEPVKKTTTHHEIVTSHGEQVNVDPTNAQSLIDVLIMYGEKSPNKPHIYFQNEDGGEEIITYGEMLKQSLCVANSLRQLGLKERDTVAIMQPTHPGFFYTFFGTLLAGGIPVPIYPPFRAHMLEAYAKTEARILKNAEVRFLVTFEQAEQLSHLLQAFVPSLKVVTTVAALLSQQPLYHPYQAKSDSYAFIQYTSGSTSDPKGVLLTHYNLISNIKAYGKAIEICPDDVAVSWLPLYHDMGLIGMWLGSLFHGVPLILMTPFSFLNHPERWLWAIHYHRGTLSGAPNFAYELCIRKIEPHLIEGLDLSSWRMAANGAEKVYPRTLQQFTEKFAPYGFKRTVLLPVYGLAESTVGLAIPAINREYRIDQIDRKKFEEDRQAIPAEGENTLTFAGCGKPIENHEIRITNDDNQVLPERSVGNLQFRGPSSMQGYYNNPRATQAIFHDGWWDSGDLAYQAEGEIFITGRRKDLIIKAGRNLYPAEIEELVGGVEGVRQGCVAAFGVSDTNRATEQLIIVAEVRENIQLNDEKIITDIKNLIATTLDIVPDEIVLVAPRTVPKTSSGKLQRAACKKMYVEGRLGKKQVPAWMQISKLGTEWFFQKIWHGLKVLSKFIYTGYVVLLAGITLAPIYLVIKFSSDEKAAKICKKWARFLHWVALCPMQVIGKENLNKTTPIIYTANHASYVDAIVTLSLLPAGTRFVGKKELFSIPIIRTFMQKLNFISVDRLDLPKGVEDTRVIEKVLKAGNSVLIFPEGTFGYASGLRPFRLGAFKVAAETNTPICPIALKGTRFILRDDEKLMKPGRVTITVCEPIAPKGAEWQDVTQLRNIVRADIAKYCGEPSLDYIAAQAVADKPPA